MANTTFNVAKLFVRATVGGDLTVAKLKDAIIVADKYDSDWFEDNESAIFCTNPNNTMEKEWTSPSQRENIMKDVENTPFKEMIEEGQVFIARYLSPFEISKKNRIFANIKNQVNL